MFPPPLLLHGALGPLDEIALLLAVGIFALMLIAPLVNTWLRRDSQSHQLPMPEGATPDGPAQAEPDPAPNTDDHYRLE